MATPQETQNGAASFFSVQDKLAAIIYLLNTTSMSAQTIQTNSVPYQQIQDKLAAIISLLADGNIAGNIGGAVSGSGSPVGVVDPASAIFYFDKVNINIWASDGVTWKQQV